MTEADGCGDGHVQWADLLFDDVERDQIDRVIPIIQKQFPDTPEGVCRSWAQMIVPAQQGAENPHHHGRADLERLEKIESHLNNARAGLHKLSAPTANALVQGLRKRARQDEVTDLLYSLQLLIRHLGAVREDLAGTLAPPGKRRKGGRTAWKALYVTEKILDCWDALSGSSANRDALGPASKREGFIQDILDVFPIGMTARSAFQALARERSTLFPDF